MTEPQPFREPLRVTLRRTLSVAAVAAAIVALSTGRIRRWPSLALLMLWPSFGGHWVDVFFLNGVRPRISPNVAIQRLARVAVWFGGGVVLGAGMRLTARVLPDAPRLGWLTWTTAGAAFVAIEIVTHGAVWLRRRASFRKGPGERAR